MRGLIRYVFVLLLLSSWTASAGDKRTLSLRQAVEMAKDSSLSTLRHHNIYAADYWQWRTYKADRLPSLSLDLTPVQYNRFITQRYNYDDNIDVFRPQRMFLSSGRLNLSQNVDFLGGTLYLESDLEYMRNFGGVTSNQFSAVPVRIGYSQQLIGYNAFRWDRKIEPLKYEKAEKELLSNMEAVSVEVVALFFDLALAQTEYRLAVENVASCDTLYAVGERRFKIAAISEDELLTLRLDKVNAENSLENARIGIKKRMFALASYLGLDKDTEIEVRIPGRPSVFEISLDRALENARLHNPELIGQQEEILKAQQHVSKTGAEMKFNASMNISVGFNQIAPTLPQSYRNLLQQDIVSVGLSIPLVDWGVRRGRHNMAKNNLNVAEISARQSELQLEQEVMMTVNDFHTQARLIESAQEALDLADRAYGQTQQRFMIGKADINSLTLSRSRQQEASRNYISVLQNYWTNYFKIRKLTLYDFASDRPVTVGLDPIIGLR